MNSTYNFPIWSWDGPVKTPEMTMARWMASTCAASGFRRLEARLSGATKSSKDDAHAASIHADSYESSGTILYPAQGLTFTRRQRC